MDALAEVDPALTPEPGLQDLEPADRGRIEVASPRQLEGSVAIDRRLADTHPSESRWDYGIACAGKVWFVEVHPASSDAGIHEVIAKARWLLGVIRGRTLQERSRGLYWVASGRVSTAPAFSRKRRLLAQAGVVGRSVIAVSPRQVAEDPPPSRSRPERVDRDDQGSRRRRQCSSAR